MRKVLLAATVGATLLASASAGAVTTTTTFQVSATVLKTCSVTAGALGFGNYTPGAGAATASSTVNVNCTKSTGFTVALDAGTTTGATIAQRLMKDSGSNTLQYNLYTANTYTTVWGDGSGTSATQAGTGAGVATAVPFTVYGQLPDNVTNQAAPPGSYTDTVKVTVTY